MSVTEEPENSRFVGEGDADGAELNYRATDGRLEITRTFTPPNLRGRGVASQLVAAAVGRAKANDEIVVPSCWYARQWIDENPDAVAGVKVA